MTKALQQEADANIRSMRIMNKQVIEETKEIIDFYSRKDFLEISMDELDTLSKLLQFALRVHTCDENDRCKLYQNYQQKLKFINRILGDKSWQ